MAAFIKRSSMFVFLLLAKAFALVHAQGTRVGFYSASCHQAEFIVQLTVATHFQSDLAIALGLLRMHFHYCFVRGYDASILINGTSTEKTTIPNRFLEGYDAIDDAKSKIEDVCPRVVSCQFFSYRLYNFSNTSTNGDDPSMDTAFVSQLQKMCPANHDGSKRIALDTSSSDRFDGYFFTNLRNGRGILELIQKLRIDAFTRAYCHRLNRFLSSCDT